MSSRPGEQAPRLQLHERRRDQQELGGDVEIDTLHALDLGAEGVDDARERDLPEVDLFLQDEVEEQVERAFEDRRRHLVRHDLIRSELGQPVGVRLPGRITRLSYWIITRENALAPVVCAVVARVFSGIQPTGDMHLGNYLGAVRRWVDDQPAAGSDAAANHDAVFCVVDLHTLTAALRPGRAHARQPAGWRRCCSPPGSIRSAACCSCRATSGPTPSSPGCSTASATFGELRRMTQFKEKSKGQESVSVGLFDYPVLMAADILLYDTDEVPVGDDQRQHVELTRDIAIRFNHQFGDMFTIPKATFPPFGARIMDLQDPTKKMSKSDESPQGTILVMDDPKAITKKIKSAVTDSETSVRHDRDAKPGISNLIEIYAAVTGQTIAAVEREFGDRGYGTFKVAVAEAVVEYLRPGASAISTSSTPTRPRSNGTSRSAPTSRRALADPVLARATTAAGLLPRRAAELVYFFGTFQGAGSREIRRTGRVPATLPRSLPASRRRLSVPTRAQALEHDRLGAAILEGLVERRSPATPSITDSREIRITALVGIDAVEVRGVAAQVGVHARLGDDAAGVIDPPADRADGPPGVVYAQAEPRRPGGSRCSHPGRTWILRLRRLWAGTGTAAVFGVALLAPDRRASTTEPPARRD